MRKPENNVYKDTIHYIHTLRQISIEVRKYPNLLLAGKCRQESQGFLWIIHKITLRQKKKIYIQDAK